MLSKPIKLGIITVLTGSDTTLFGPGLKALEMEVEKINAQGGILGERIKLIVRNFKGKPKRCIEHFKCVTTKRIPATLLLELPALKLMSLHLWLRN